MLPLTPTQNIVLTVIRKYIAAHDVAPTLQEIGDEMRVSKVTVFEHVHQLARKGYIRLHPSGSRRIELVDDPTKLAIRDALKLLRGPLTREDREDAVRLLERVA